MGTLLVQAYGACGEPKTAISVFRGLFSRDTDAWAAAMEALATNGKHQEVINMFREMILEGCTLGASNFLHVLKSCGEIGASKEARLLNACVRSSSWSTDIDVLNQLVETLNQVGALEEGEEVLRLATRGANEKTWRIRMETLVKNLEFDKALKLFFKLRNVRDKKICSSALESCASLSETRAVHERLKKFGMANDGELCTMLFKGYIQLGSFEEARLVFDAVEKKSVEWWENMADAYAMSGDARKLLAHYRCMSLNGIKYSLKFQNELLETCRGVAEGMGEEKIRAIAD